MDETATAILARDMVRLEAEADDALRHGRLGEYVHLRSVRDDLRHQRSLLLRQQWWAERALHRLVHV